MTDTQSFYEYFREHNFTLTLGEIMKTEFACEYRKHFTLLRKAPEFIGKQIRVKLNKKNPSENLYFVEEEAPAPTIFETDGQARMEI